MKKIITYIALFSLGTAPVSAQKKLNPKPVYSEWETNPMVHPAPPELKYEPAFFVTNEVTLDYRYEGRSINLYYTLHRIIKVLDNKGIEMFNKIIIPVDHNTRVPLIKARTIMPDGRVYEVAKDMMKVTKDETGRHTVVIAMEGVARDAEVEILVKEIRPGSMFGGMAFQFPVPVLNTRFELSSPDEMIFEEKGFNGFPDAESVVENNRRHIFITKSGIPALHPEPHSFYELYQMRAEYRIVSFVDKNENDKRKLFTCDDFGRTLYNNHCKITDKERATVNRYLSDLGVVTNGKEFENIKKIENGIKNNIVQYVYLPEEKAENLDSIIKNKAATEAGFIKLFSACFNQAGVKNELGMTFDRREHTLDSKFENWGNMENYIFYFPDRKKFLSPTNVFTRYPVVPDEVLNTKGVFCTIPPNGITIGGLSEIKTIKPLGVDESRKNITATVNFTPDMDALVDVTYSYSGYPAADLRKQYSLLPPNKVTDWVRKLLPLSERPEDINKYTVTNEGFDNSFTNKPFEIYASLNAPQLVEQAGSRSLFRLGDVIGGQDELYSKKERKLPLDLMYPYSLNRTITINIPKGYKILNPEAIRMDADYVKNDLNPVIGFKSDYVLKTDKKNGDTLVITVNEFYSQIHFSVAEYEQYRKVFNAAADFNKVILVMDKQETPAAKPKKKKKPTA